MKKSNPQSNEVKSYIAGFPQPARRMLEQMRATIRKVAPAATEAIKYRIPTFVLGGNLVHFAGFDKHIGLYPGASGVAAFRDQLAGFKSAKGSIQFPLDAPLPLKLIEQIVHFRVKEAEDRAATGRTKRSLGREAKKAVSKTVQVEILQNGAMCAIPVPFDSKALFGKVRAPVRVTINGYTFRSTIARMGGQTFIPLRKSNREAAAVAGGERVKVRIEADTEQRSVDVPSDLGAALAARKGVREQWERLSYTHRREAVESVTSARRPETRARRIAGIVESLMQPRG
jgi:uncharacterized protein YdhG (YjbR/CyaY superfamily)